MSDKLRLLGIPLAIAQLAFKTFLKLSNQYYQTMVDRWPAPPSSTGQFFAVIIAALILASIANFAVRNSQLEAWQAVPNDTFIAGAPSFSTTDAPYFLNHAASIKLGESISEFYQLRSYPNQYELKDNVATDTPLRSRPLLSVLLALTVDTPSPTELLTAGNYLVPITAGITALMLAFCFGAAGYWLEGAVAAIGGGLSASYLFRSSIGRIDTDQLNLGFMYMMFGLVIFAGRSMSWRWCLVWCFAAGICANLFLWWYGKSELVFLGAFSLAWILMASKRNLAVSLAGFALFVLSSGVNFTNPYELVYLKDILRDGRFLFPNTFSTITEMQRSSIPAILGSISGSIEMGLVGLCGLALFAVRHPVLAITYGPLASFALLNLLIGNRAIFYSAPITWFGVAFLVTTATRFLSENLASPKSNAKRHHISTTLGAVVAMLLAWVNSPTNYVPRPSFSKPVLEGFLVLKNMTEPHNSAMVSWWDYGYASIFFNALPTLHDGGMQVGPTTHFVARALLEPDMSQGIGTLKFLSTQGHKGIAASDGLENLETAFREANAAPSPDLYLVVTGQMAGWMGSISKIGNWDIEQGRPIQLRGNPDGPEVHYTPINCRFGGYPRHLNCGGVKIDLERGLIGSHPSLVGWTHTQDGKVLRSRSFDHDADHAIQIVQDGNSITVFMLHRQLYDSTFNRLYYQGTIDHPAISLHYDDYPHIRIYRIDGTPSG